MVKKRIIQVVHRATQLVHSNTFLLYRGTQQTFALNASQYLDLADIFFFYQETNGKMVKMPWFSSVGHNKSSFLYWNAPNFFLPGWFFVSSLGKSFFCNIGLKSFFSDLSVAIFSWSPLSVKWSRTHPRLIELEYIFTSLYIIVNVAWDTKNNFCEYFATPSTMHTSLCVYLVRVFINLN